MSRSSLEEMQCQLDAAAEAFVEEDELVFKPMFGGVCAYVKGRVFASLSNAGLALKLSPDAQTELLRIAGAKRLQYEADAPVSKQYIVVPPQVRRDDASSLANWVGHSITFVLAHPAPKPRRKKTC